VEDKVELRGWCVEIDLEALGTNTEDVPGASVDEGFRDEDECCVVENPDLWFYERQDFTN
jgi:hypothetical protein